MSAARNCHGSPSTNGALRRGCPSLRTLWRVEQHVPGGAIGPAADHNRHSVASALRGATARLTEAGVPSPSVDAELLLAHATGSTRGEVRLAQALDRSLSPVEHARFIGLIAQRAERIPLQHLTGVAPFRRLTLQVGPGVFVPRPETELLVELALEALVQSEARGATETRVVPRPVHELRVLDLCTGSGAIALAIADEAADHVATPVSVRAIERESSAYAWAARNVANTAIDLIQADVRDLGQDFVSLADWRGAVQVIATNPPYVPEEAVPVDPEVAIHDPRSALYSGADGLDLIRVIADRASVYAAPQATLLIEHAEAQGAAVREILTRTGWIDPRTHADLSGRDRVTLARRPAESGEPGEPGESGESEDPKEPERRHSAPEA